MASTPHDLPPFPFAIYAIGELGKGMTAAARFLTARRTLLQILYQATSEWLDPQSTSQRP
ncbi:MAG: hypothetical protein HYV95_16035 [Opitutae bacterium]|nr:hypothetical protein [Opitutae bacterium]